MPSVHDASPGHRMEVFPGVRPIRSATSQHDELNNVSESVTTRSGICTTTTSCEPVPKIVISVFPLELLAMVFLYLMDIYVADADMDLLSISLEMIHHRSSWLSVTCVSRHWRQAALSCQPLWDFILVTKNGDFKRRYSLAGSARPLSVVCIDTESPDAEWTSVAVRRTVEENFPRLRHLVLRGPDSWLTGTSSEVAALTLESLALCCTTTAPGNLSDLFKHGTLPALHAVSLQNYTVPFPCGVLSSTLRVLNIKGATGGTRPTRESLFACLRQMHFLEVLSLDHMLPRGLRTGDGLFVLGLPHLRAIALSDLTARCALFLDLLSFPPETRITLDCIAEHLALLNLPTDILSDVLSLKMLECAGRVASFASLVVECLTTYDTDQRVKTVFRVRAWRFPRLLQSDFGYMQAGTDVETLPPDLDLTIASFFPFRLSDVFHHIPLDEVRSLGLSCSACLAHKIRDFVSDVTIRLCPNVHVLGIMDAPPLYTVSYLLAARIRTPSDMSRNGRQGHRTRPLLAELTQFILPDLGILADDQISDPSDFVASMTYSFNRRKPFGGRSVLLTMSCGGKLTEAAHKSLRRAAGRLKCATCSDSESI